MKTHLMLNFNDGKRILYINYDLGGGTNEQLSIMEFIDGQD